MKPAGIIVTIKPGFTNDQPTDPRIILEGHEKE